MHFSTHPALFALFWTGLSLTIPGFENSALERREPAQCPLYLPSVDNFEFPHRIQIISSRSPGAVLGNSFSPSVSPNDFATIFNFDVPQARAGEHCQLFFSLPTQDQLTTSSFSVWGPGTFTWQRYEFNAGASDLTTWSNQPKFAGEGNGISGVTLTNVTPGTSHMVWDGDCGKVSYINGQKSAEGGLVSWRMSSADTCLWYFQDWNLCAIGLWLVYGDDKEQARFWI